MPGSFAQRLFVPRGVDRKLNVLSTCAGIAESIQQVSTRQRWKGVWVPMIG